MNERFSRPTLVFGDDGSEASDVAWAWICAQKWSGWDLLCLHADPPEIPKATGDPLAEAPREWEPPQRFRRVPPTGTELESVRYMKSDADPRIALAHASGAELLVIGAGRVKRPFPFMIGSTAQYLLADPPTPLVVVKKGVPVRKVLAAVDGSLSALAAVEAFARMPWAAHAKVEIVTARHGAVDADQAQQAASKVLGAVLDPDLVSAVTLDVKPVQGLLARLKEAANPPDLVIAGTRGHTTLPRPHIGSLTLALVHRADVNFLVASSRLAAAGPPS